MNNNTDLTMCAEQHVANRRDVFGCDPADEDIEDAWRSEVFRALSDDYRDGIGLPHVTLNQWTAAADEALSRRA